LVHASGGSSSSTCCCFSGAVVYVGGIVADAFSASPSNAARRDCIAIISVGRTCATTGKPSTIATQISSEEAGVVKAGTAISTAFVRTR
jgi:hypothetical protein